MTDFPVDSRIPPTGDGPDLGAIFDALDAIDTLRTAAGQDK